MTHPALDDITTLFTTAADMARFCRMMLNGGALGSVRGMSDRIEGLAKALEPGARNLPALAGDARKTMASADAALRDLTPALQEAKTALAAEEQSQPEHADHIRLLREFLETSTRGIVR